MGNRGLSRCLSFLTSKTNNSLFWYVLGRRDQFWGTNHCSSVNVFKHSNLYLTWVIFWKLFTVLFCFYFFDRSLCFLLFFLMAICCIHSIIKFFDNSVNTNINHIFVFIFVVFLYEVSSLGFCEHHSGKVQIILMSCKLSSLGINLHKYYINFSKKRLIINLDKF